MDWPYPGIEVYFAREGSSGIECAWLTFPDGAESCVFVHEPVAREDRMDWICDLIPVVVEEWLGLSPSVTQSVYSG